MLYFQNQWSFDIVLDYLACNAPENVQLVMMSKWYDIELNIDCTVKRWVCQWCIFQVKMNPNFNVIASFCFQKEFRNFCFSNGLGQIRSNVAIMCLLCSLIWSQLLYKVHTLVTSVSCSWTTSVSWSNHEPVPWPMSLMISIMVMFCVSCQFHWHSQKLDQCHIQHHDQYHMPWSLITDQYHMPYQYHDSYHNQCHCP